MKRIKIIDKSKILLILILVFFYGLLFKPTEQNVFSLAFGDESDNFVSGKFLNKGEKLYSDIFIQHQPTATLISAAIQKSLPINSLFLLVKRHREFIFLYSALAFVLLVLRFGYTVFVFATLYELTKFILFGNLFLAEALVIPPLILLIAYIHLSLSNRLKSVTKKELALIAISLVFIQFTLLPLIFFVLISGILILFKLPKSLKILLIKYYASLTIVAILLFSRFLSFKDYFIDTIYVNFFGQAPTEVIAPLYIVISRIFLSPILVFFLPKDSFFILLNIISALFIFSLIALVYFKQTRFALVMYALLVTVNLRPVKLDIIYQGFHLLPFYAVLLMITLLQLDTIKKIINRSRRVSFVVVILVLLYAFFIPFGYKEFSREDNQATDLYVNYSTFYDYGEAIKLLSDKNDNMLSTGGSGLIYWQSDLKNSSPFFFTSGFFSENVFLNTKIKYYYNQNPPVFLFKDGGGELYKDKLYGSKSLDYVNIPKGDKKSNLYVLKNKFNQIGEEKWKSVLRLGFQKPKSDAL